MERAKHLKKTLTKTSSSSEKVSSSFRDPSGFVFTRNKTLYRQINPMYQKDYEFLMRSGLYKELTEEGMLIEHAEVTAAGATKDAWRVIQPEVVPFISYPYEWAFSMLKDAALLTLEIQKTAIKYGMSLKDASAFNIQFVKGKPVLIDTLSFETYEEGRPWVAYKQFVEHFLAPLVLMVYVDVRLGKLSSVFLDGIPVDLAAPMLPFKARFRPSLLFHIFAHARSSKKYSDKKIDKNMKNKKFSKRALLGLIDNLEGSVKGLEWRPQGTEWEDYYEDDKNNYKSESFKHKGDMVKKYIQAVGAATVWDLGANTGHFSRIAASIGAQVISFDVDDGAIEKNYRDIKRNAEESILPVFSDLTNPTPSVGWANEERMSLEKRAPADCLLALALIHHLSISRNIPFSHVASFFSKLGKNLVIEFIQKEDSQVQILLSTRKDIFSMYNMQEFEAAFGEFFAIKQKTKLKGTLRTLYLMERK